MYKGPEQAGIFIKMLQRDVPHQSSGKLKSKLEYITSYLSEQILIRIIMGAVRVKDLFELLCTAGICPYGK